MGRRNKSSPALNGLSDGNRFVGGQVVDNDDIARGQCWNQACSTGQESRSIHGSVRNHRSGHTRRRKAADECGGSGDHEEPALGIVVLEAHVRILAILIEACLIDENQLLKRQPAAYRTKPLDAAERQGAAVRLRRRFFESHVAVQQTPDRAEMSEGHEYLQDTRRSPKVYPASHQPDWNSGKGFIRCERLSSLRPWRDMTVPFH